MHCEPKHGMDTASIMVWAADPDGADAWHWNDTHQQGLAKAAALRQATSFLCSAALEDSFPGLRHQPMLKRASLYDILLLQGVGSKMASASVT